MFLNTILFHFRLCPESEVNNGSENQTGLTGADLAMYLKTKSQHVGERVTKESENKPRMRTETEFVKCERCDQMLEIIGTSQTTILRHRKVCKKMSKF